MRTRSLRPAIVALLAATTVAVAPAAWAQAGKLRFGFDGAPCST